MAPIVTATLSSSSTTSRLPVAMLGRASNGQGDAESGAPTFAASQLDRAAMRLDDALRDPQPQACALLVFGREKGLENMRQVLLGDALAGIPNLDVDRIRHQELGVCAVRDTRRDEQRTSVR